MIRRFIRTIALACALASTMLLAACPGTIPTSTFNDKAAIAIQSVTAVRKAATSLLVAHKITVAEDETLQQQLDALRALIEVATAMQSTDPVAAQAKLEQAIAQLAQLKQQMRETP